jgi:hypothetical protein
LIKFFKIQKKGKKMKPQKMYVIVALVCILGFAPAANAEWHFGIGTGLGAMSVKGDMGFNVVALGIGPVKMKLDMSPSDIMNSMDGAFGLGVFATDGRWVIESSFNMLRLEGNPVKTVGANTVAADLSFDVKVGDLTVGYPVYADPGFVLRGYTGFRYIGHKLDTKVDVTSGGVTTTRIDRNIDEDWTDALIGLSLDMALAENWRWDTKFDYGFGGSEGSYLVNTGVSWRFSPHWSTTLFAQYYAIEFENGSAGDADWYLYDMDESTMGLKIAYSF